MTPLQRAVLISIFLNISLSILISILPLPMFGIGIIDENIEMLKKHNTNMLSSSILIAVVVYLSGVLSNILKF